MTQVLNLDVLKTSRTVTLGGKNRPVNSMTVQQFIDADDVEKALEGANGAGRIKLIVDQIIGFMPDTTREELMGLEFPQLSALLTFIRGDDAKEEKNAAPEGNEIPKSS